MEVKRTYLQLNDGRTLAYHDDGNLEGKPLLLLHGAPGYSSYWYYLGGFPATGSEYRIITVDRCGYGESDFKKGTTFLSYADDLIQLLEHLKIDKTSILGVSGGGPFALAFAKRYPEKTEKVTLLSTAVPITVPEIERSISENNRKAFKVARVAPWLMRLNMAGFAMYLKKDAMKLFDKMSYKYCEADKEAVNNPILREAMCANGKYAFVKSSKGYANDVILQSKDWGFDFSSIATKVIIIQCMDDTSSPKEVGYHFDTVLPNCTLHCIEGAGHFWHMMHMDKVFAMI